MTNRKKSSRKKLTILVALVAFVFVVLLISIAISSIMLFVLNRHGLMQPITGSHLPAILGFLLVVSLFVGLIITTIAGNLSLRPLKKFIDATKQIASGNFDVHVDTRGPDEYSALASSFNEMAKELSSIETLRNDFVSNISHEYKTPMVSIRGFAKLLKKGNLSKEQQDEYLDIILSESDRLVQLSSNVLLLSKLDSRDALGETAVFSLDEQLRTAILLLDQQFEEKGLETLVELQPCQIQSNQEMLQQVWINLLNNAIKFTPQGGSVFVSLLCREDCAQITIRDSGIGMDEETLGHIFDKFYQGDVSRSTQGNGLGLSLVKRIVQLCGGQIHVESSPGNGSAFMVTLPK